MSKGESNGKQGKRRIRPVLLILLWVWAILMFVVIDLFTNVEEFDRVRPDSPIYQGMRKAAHEMVGERFYDQVAPAKHLKRSGSGSHAEGSTGGGKTGTQLSKRRKGRRPIRLPRDGSASYLRHGTFTQWNDPGNQRGNGKYKDGFREGTWMWFWSAGVKREIREYRHGILHGEVRSFFESGKPESEEHYKGNKPHGDWRMWHHNGELAAQEKYIDGKLHGTAVRWHDNGKKAAEATYDNGVPQGVMTFWRKNGDKAEEGEFVNGKRHGLWTKWDESGRVVLEERYDSGRKLP